MHRLGEGGGTEEDGGVLSFECVGAVLQAYICD